MYVDIGPNSFSASLGAGQDVDSSFEGMAQVALFVHGQLHAQGMDRGGRDGPIAGGFGHQLPQVAGVCDLRPRHEASHCLTNQKMTCLKLRGHVVVLTSKSLWNKLAQE